MVTADDGTSPSSTVTAAGAPLSSAVYEEALNVTVVRPAVALATLEWVPVPLLLMAETR